MFAVEELAVGRDDVHGMAQRLQDPVAVPVGEPGAVVPERPRRRVRERDGATP